MTIMVIKYDKSWQVKASLYGLHIQIILGNGVTFANGSGADITFPGPGPGEYKGCVLGLKMINDPMSRIVLK